MPPKTKHVHCDSCNVLAINNVICHEYGCPEAWKSQKVPCFICGFNFIREERYQTVCNDCNDESLSVFEDSQDFG